VSDVIYIVLPILAIFLFYLYKDKDSRSFFFRKRDWWNWGNLSFMNLLILIGAFAIVYALVRVIRWA